MGFNMSELRIFCWMRVSFPGENNHEKNADFRKNIRIGEKILPDPFFYSSDPKVSGQNGSVEPEDKTVFTGKINADGMMK